MLNIKSFLLWLFLAGITIFLANGQTEIYSNPVYPTSRPSYSNTEYQSDGHKNLDHTIYENEYKNMMGFAISISPETTWIASSSPFNTFEESEINIYKRDEQYSVYQNIKQYPTNSNEYFGYDIEFYNSTHLLVGSPSKSNEYSGNIYIYSLDLEENIWTFENKVNFENTQNITDPYFGSSISTNSNLDEHSNYIVSSSPNGINYLIVPENNEWKVVKLFGMIERDFGVQDFTFNPTLVYSYPNSTYSYPNSTYSYPNSTHDNPEYENPETDDYKVDIQPWFPKYFRNESWNENFFIGKTMTNYISGDLIFVGEIINSRVSVYKIDLEDYQIELLNYIYPPSYEYEDGFGSSIVLMDNFVIIGTPYTRDGGNAYGYQIESRIKTYLSNNTTIEKEMINFNYLGSLPDRYECNNFEDKNNTGYPICTNYGCYYPPNCVNGSCYPPNCENDNCYPPYCTDHGCYYPPNSNRSYEYPPWCVDSWCYYPPNSNGSYPYPPNFNWTDGTHNMSNIYNPWCNEFYCYFPPYDGNGNYSYPPWCQSSGCYYPIQNGTLNYNNNSTRAFGSDPNTWTPNFGSNQTLSYPIWNNTNWNNTNWNNTNPTYPWCGSNGCYYPPWCESSGCYYPPGRNDTNTYPPWCGPDGCYYPPGYGNNTWNPGYGNNTWCGPDGCYYPPGYGNNTWCGDRPCNYCSECEENSGNYEDPIIICDQDSEFGKSIGVLKIREGEFESNMLIIGVPGLRTLAAYQFDSEKQEIYEKGTLPIETNQWFSFGSELIIKDDIVIISGPYSNEGEGMFMIVYTNEFEKTNRSDNGYYTNNSSNLSTPSSTITPTTTPTFTPTTYPTDHPTFKPTSRPTFNQPTVRPTGLPSARPTTVPSSVPTSRPTGLPTGVPTSRPTNRPTSVPTGVPTSRPTSVPTRVPTSVPTRVPTSVPTRVPTSVPTRVPTSAPTVVPTSRPTNVPTSRPTGLPTGRPTGMPSNVPTNRPTGLPTGRPTGMPSNVPTNRPTGMPSGRPTLRPSTTKPSGVPSGRPTLRPSTMRPSSSKPTIKPSTSRPVSK